MNKTMVINEVCSLASGSFEIDTIIHNGGVMYFVIAKDLPKIGRNWEVLAFGSVADIFVDYFDHQFDYKVDLKWRKGEAFATYEEYVRWFNSKVSNDDVEEIESDLLTW